MQKLILFLSAVLLLNVEAFAEDKCFLVKENNKVLIEEGDCGIRYSPA